MTKLGFGKHTLANEERVTIEARRLFINHLKMSQTGSREHLWYVLEKGEPVGIVERELLGVIEHVYARERADGKEVLEVHIQADELIVLQVKLHSEFSRCFLAALGELPHKAIGEPLVLEVEAGQRAVFCQLWYQDKRLSQHERGSGVTALLEHVQEKFGLGNPLGE